MSAFGWSLVEWSARLLQGDERESVLGDLAEENQSAWRGLFEVLNLFFRRQALLWWNLKPWIAGFLVVLPSSQLLMYVSVSVSCTYARLVYHKLLFGKAYTGHEGYFLLLCHIFLLLAWSWVAGYVTGSLSRRTAWVSVVLAVAACSRHFPETTWGDISIPRILFFLFVPPALLGLWQGFRGVRVTRNVAALLAITITLLMIIAWSSNALWSLNWVLIWPAWCLVTIASKPSLLAAQTN
jgi:hypothetical protein